MILSNQEVNRVRERNIINNTSLKCLTETKYVYLPDVLLSSSLESSPSPSSSSIGSVGSSVVCK